MPKLDHSHPLPDRNRMDAEGKCGTTTEPDLIHLRKIAENAESVLPEPWIVMDASRNTVSVVECSQSDGSIISGGAVADAHTTPFRDHIAAFDPPTVLALIARAAAAEQAVARVEKLLSDCVEVEAVTPSMYDRIWIASVREALGGGKHGQA